MTNTMKAKMALFLIQNPRPDGRGFVSLSPSAKVDSATPILRSGFSESVINKEKGDSARMGRNQLPILSCR